MVAAARRSLAALQLADGAVPVIPECPSATWPTSLAILAWLPDPAFHPHARAAADWMLSHRGKRWSRELDSDPVLGHDPGLRGWSWTVGTYSWVEPTALAMLALTAMGEGKSLMQLAEATMMLLDRELPDGGWNYGNTRVFLNVLLPIPEYTGLALAALGAFAMRPERSIIERSLKYLASNQCASSTPLIATWKAFAFRSWNKNVTELLGTLVSILGYQLHYGSYNTPVLAQLLAAIVTDGNFPFLTNQTRR